MTDTETKLMARQVRRLRPWAEKAVQLVSGKLSDARAHAEKAVTDTLKATPDGRPSLAVIRRNPSFKAALNRLDELWSAIAGPSVTSIAGMVHDATEDFYADARAFWFAETPGEYRVESAEPTGAQRAYVRGLLWFGLPIRSDFEPQFKRLRNGLSASVGAMGSRGINAERSQVTTLRTWETQARNTMMRRVGLALNDANQRADLQAMKDSIKPEYQHES